LPRSRASRSRLPRGTRTASPASFPADTRRRVGPPRSAGVGGRTGDGGACEPQASRGAGAPAWRGGESGLTDPPQPTVIEPWLDDPLPDYDAEQVVAYANG